MLQVMAALEAEGEEGGKGAGGGAPLRSLADGYFGASSTFDSTGKPRSVRTAPTPIPTPLLASYKMLFVAALLSFTCNGSVQNRSIELA